MRLKIQSQHFNLIQAKKHFHMMKKHFQLNNIQAKKQAKKHFHITKRILRIISTPYNLFYHMFNVYYMFILLQFILLLWVERLYVRGSLDQNWKNQIRINWFGKLNTINPKSTYREKNRNILLWVERLYARGSLEEMKAELIDLEWKQKTKR